MYVWVVITLGFNRKDWTPEKQKWWLKLRQFPKKKRQYRRMLTELLDKGYQVGLYQTASWMKRAEVVTTRPRKKYYYADNGKEQKYFPNLLNRIYQTFHDQRWTQWNWKDKDRLCPQVLWWNQPENKSGKYEMKYGVVNSFSKLIEIVGAGKVSPNGGIFWWVMK